MARIETEFPVKEVSGKFSKKSNIITRIRNGKKFTYELTKPCRPAEDTEKQKAHMALFSATSRQVRTEMADPERLAFWQAEYEAYKADKNNKPRTIRDYIFHILYTQAKAQQS